ncbi:hypothetical protein BH10BAC1_BH10BAC1_13890 [soil metagenome]
MQLFAQTPGYMGKRFTVMYTNSISPGFWTYLYGDRLHPVLSHTLKMNVIVSKQREICLAAQFSNRKIGIIDNQFLPSTSTVLYEKFGSLEYSFGLKRFNRSKFAPLGGYAKWDISYIMGWVKYAGYTTYSNDPAGNSETLHDGGSIAFKGVGGSYSRGRQRVFKDKVVVDFGLRATLIGLTETKNTKNNYESEIGSRVTGSLNLNPLVNVYIGIGFLAF